ncbi:PorV/PorQ family protein, partial [bacterium]|nr:PorV/PorQ family protein [bacterium]
MRRRGPVIVLLLAVLSVLAAAPAFALPDDGGVRSVFALGAGNRAIGLGGAYAAIADDASAALWNPAGLALLDRRHVEFTSTNLFGMGFSEKYVSLAYPHWRLGNASLTLRTFGVDGIESRDDRNVLLADDLKDQELEILLAYARALRSGVNVGGGFKLQRHSLAGYAGSGFGIDAGVLVHPLVLRGGDSPAARAWTLGLAIRNLVEPSVRLDVESVPDPRAMRLGTAWRRPLGETLRGLLSLDLEKTAGMDSRLHLGAEVDYRDQAALRLGVLAGTLTAGFGLRWRDVLVDFAFEDHRLGAVKRLGVSFLHGPPVDQVRHDALARAAEDQRLQMDRAFAESDRARREQLLASARSAFSAGDHSNALDRLSMSRLLDPDNAQAAALELEVLGDLARVQVQAGDLASAIITLGQLTAKAPQDTVAQAELQRLRDLSAVSARRSHDIEDLYARGLDAFVADELDEAHGLFAEALGLAPQDADILAMLDRVQRKRTQRLAAVCGEARSLVRVGLVDEAEAAVARAASLGAPADTLSSLRSSIGERRRQLAYEQERRQREHEMAAQLAALGNEPPVRADAKTGTGALPPTLSASRRQELAALSRRARELFDAGDADEAVRIWELVWSENPHGQEVCDALREEYLTRGMAAYAAGDLAGAVKIWEQALRVAPDDPRTQGYLERARQQQARIRALQDSSRDGAG